MAEAKDDYSGGDKVNASDVNQHAKNANDAGGFRDDKLAGETIAGATLPVPVYQNTTDNEFYACDANDTAKLNFVGFAISNSTDGNAIDLQMSGIVKGFTGLDEGEKYYVQDAVGTIGKTPGTAKILVGEAISTTELLIIKDRISEVDYNMNITTVSDSNKANGTFTLDIDLGIRFNFFEVDFELGVGNVPNWTPNYGIKRFLVKGSVEGDKMYILRSAAINNYDSFGSKQRDDLRVNEGEYTITLSDITVTRSSLIITVTGFSIVGTNLRITYTISGCVDADDEGRIAIYRAVGKFC